MATRLRSASSSSERASCAIEVSREANAPLCEPVLCVRQRRVVRHVAQSKDLAEVARVRQDRDDAAIVGAEELPQRRDREELMLCELLGTALGAISRKGELRRLQRA